MMRLDRLNSMEEYVHECGSVSLSDLAKKFNISINTVRRDVEELLERGTMKKVYGGVASNITTQVMPISDRENTNIAAKQSIGKMVAKLIDNDSTVFIDSGSTPAQVIQHLGQKNNITVITNSLKAMYESSKYPNIRLLGIGGLYNTFKGSFVGSSTLENISKLNFDVVLLGSTCISLENGLTINSFFEVDIKRWLVQHNKRTILMADTSKYDKTALYSFSDFSDVKIVAAEKPLPPRYMKEISERGMTFLCPDN